MEVTCTPLSPFGLFLLFFLFVFVTDYGYPYLGIMLIKYAYITKFYSLIRLVAYLLKIVQVTRLATRVQVSKSIGLATAIISYLPTLAPIYEYPYAPVISDNHQYVFPSFPSIFLPLYVCFFSYWRKTTQSLSLTSFLPLVFVTHLFKVDGLS